MSPRRLIAALAMSAMAAGCSPSLRTSDLEFGDARGVYTNGNLRLVTERDRVQPATGLVLPTLCTEPSPDYAIAFDRSADIVAKLTKLGNGDLNLSSSEDATALAGRSAGVLALRDGLYAACQSYVNGVIGHDAYALILSQYGTLLVELMHEAPPKESPSETTDKPDKPATDKAPDKTVKSNYSDAVFREATGGATLTKTHPPSKPGGALDGGAMLEAVNARNATISALLVSCISEHDPTRIGGESGELQNPLLSRDFCRKFLRQTLHRTSR